MPTYTVALAYRQTYATTINVEADSIEEACRRALEEADDFEACDACGDTFIEAIAEGNATPWKAGALCESVLPVPAQFQETE